MHLKNPYAYIGKHLVTADTAERGQNWTCPYCKENLILKRGAVKVAHFCP